MTQFGVNPEHMSLILIQGQGLLDLLIEEEPREAF
jgi:hypothetical protein